MSCASQFSLEGWPLLVDPAISFRKHKINFEKKLSRNFVSPEIKSDTEQARFLYVDKGEDKNGRTLAEWRQRFKDISISPRDKHLVHSGLFSRLVPSLVLPKLLQPICVQQKHVRGAIAVLMTRKARTTPKSYSSFQATTANENDSSI